MVTLSPSKLSKRVGIDLTPLETVDVLKKRAVKGQRGRPAKVKMGVVEALLKMPYVLTKVICREWCEPAGLCSTTLFPQMRP